MFSTLLYAIQNKHRYEPHENQLLLPEKIK